MELPFVEQFCQWVEATRPTTIINTDSVYRAPWLKGLERVPGCVTSGLYYIPLSLFSPDYITFFRVEQVTHNSLFFILMNTFFS
jgi:light-regulated signal transduction histidine kinase (bacteriophytochrome)